MSRQTTTSLAIGILLCSVIGCVQSPYERGGHPSGYSRAEVEQDYMECEYKSRLANEQHFYSQSSPFPFGAGPVTEEDHRYLVAALQLRGHRGAPNTALKPVPGIR